MGCILTHPCKISRSEHLPVCLCHLSPEIPGADPPRPCDGLDDWPESGRTLASPSLCSQMVCLSPGLGRVLDFGGRRLCQRSPVVLLAGETWSPGAWRAAMPWQWAPVASALRRRAACGCLGAAGLKGGVSQARGRLKPEHL